MPRQVLRYQLFVALNRVDLVGRLVVIAAKREVARLRIRHLQKERDSQKKNLDIQQQREDDERKLKQQRERETLRLEHQREALKVLHSLQEAEIE